MNIFWNTKKHHYFVALFCLLLLSCKTEYTLKNTDRTNTKVTQDIAQDKEYIEIIKPYKETLDKEMNKVISVSEQEYTRSGSSTTLGNLLADLLYDESQDYCKEHNIVPVDFVLLNHGGMRRNLFKGNVTIGDVYEIAPFENELILVEISGKNMKELLNYFTLEKKGHPVSRLFVSYKNNTLQNALIADKPFDETKTYRIATNDYLQNGGDNMVFLKNPIQKTETHLKLRDIFIKQIQKHKVLPYLTNSRIEYND